MTQWLAHPLSSQVQDSLERLASQPDVERVAVMPDVHLAEDVCVGAVVATQRRLLPDAVGGDVGCGMTAVRFAAHADRLASAQDAARLLTRLYAVIPSLKHATAQALPDALCNMPTGTSALERIAQREGRLEFATLGRGNHFLEFQADQDGALWLMLHSGSRALGPTVRAHHRARARQEGGLPWLDADSDDGRAYLRDVEWCVEYARLSRRAMAQRVMEQVLELWNVEAQADTWVDCHHNHVQREQHGGQALWVHRKGALRAGTHEAGIIPGSMGTFSHLVEGRGCEAALCSCSHGAGRALSRTEARRQFSAGALAKQMGHVFYDRRHAEQLRDEAPHAYKDLARVMRAQQELVRITATLRPLLSFKGT